MGFARRMTSAPGRLRRIWVTNSSTKRAANFGRFRCRSQAIIDHRPSEAPRWISGKARTPSVDMRTVEGTIAIP